MPTDVVMPQMGESIFEGTITKWLKKPGEKVQRDEPLFEISTDKVDAEIPSPAAGVLKEIKIPEGNTVQVNTVVGVIDAEGAAAQPSAPAPAKPAPQAAKSAETKPAETKPAPQADGTSTPKQPPATEKAAPVQSSSSGGNGGGASGDGAGVDVVMPQMGESIFEGTLTKWLKKPGDQVQRDEPLFEISTDKVDAEIPAPASGVLRELKVKEGSTVQVNTVVAVIGGAGAAAKPAARPVEVAKTAEAPARPAERPSAPSVPAQREQVIGFPSDRMAEAENVRSSPLVRRIARENQVDLNQVSGTGLGGRISKTDILNFIQQHGATAPASSVQPPRPAQQPQGPTRGAAAPAMPPAPAIQELRGELVPMSPMRKKIAERMVESKRTSAHVHSIFKVDMTRIVKMRERVRRDWESRNGGKLTFMPFIARALMHGIKVRPVVNASVVGDSVQYHKNINIGIAVALDWGLIVPVVKGAENLSFVGLQRAISDLGERARNKKLVPDDVQGGTITITNPGIFGPQFGTPIILQPQVAILGVGGIFKEPTVVTDADGNDSIAVRHIVRFSLGYDHRIVDGADADQFLAAVKKYLETFDEDIG